MNRAGRRLAGWLIAAVTICCAGAAGAEQPVLNNVNKALAYVDEHRPEELDLGKVRMRPSELYTIKLRMPENAVLHFETTWQDTVITDRDTELNLRSMSYKITEEELEQLIAIVPGVQKIDVAGRNYPANKVMISLVEKYPEIEFVWIIRLNSGHALRTTDTAYSSFNDPTNKKLVRITSEDLEVLRYAPGLKALDLGHNAITSLDFLQYFPDLELLILGDNPIEDIGILGTMKHLKYLELFSVPLGDVSPLANCTEMLDLNLSYCKKVQDLEPLSGMKALERFWGTHMDGISGEQQEAFTKEHPGTDIKFNAKHATSDGWREHERYDHYIWCLKNHTWIPFDQPVPEK